MSHEEFDRTANDLLSRAQSERNRWSVLVATLIVMACTLLGVAAVTFVNTKAGDARQGAIEETLASIEGLCKSGAIDCRGHRGLPGPRGNPGGRIVSIECGHGGKFIFRMNTGRVWRVGDCIAERGPRGATGPRGRAGRTVVRAIPGPRGRDGSTGPRGSAGKPGKAGRPGPRGKSSPPKKKPGKGKGKAKGRRR